MLGEPVALPAGIDLTAYRIVQEALTNALKHAGSARALVTVAYEPNEVVLSDRGRRRGRRATAAELRGPAAATASWACASGSRSTAGSSRRAGARGGGFAVRARLPTRPLVPGAELSTAPGKVPA